LGSILAEYLTIVRPLEIFLSQKFNCKGAHELNEFLWADYEKGRWNGEFISDLLKITCSQHKMQPLGFRDYRQVAQAFMEKHLKYKVKDIQGLNAILDLQAGHNSRTAGRDYAVSTEDHGKVSREAMHQYYLASSEWHELLLSSGQQTKRNGPVYVSEDQRVVEMGSQSNGNVASILPSQEMAEIEDMGSRMPDISHYNKNGMSD